jgi:hypothetical protein
VLHGIRVGLGLNKGGPHELLDEGQCRITRRLLAFRAWAGRFGGKLMKTLRRKRLPFPKFDVAKYKRGKQKRLDLAAMVLLQDCDRLWDMSRNFDTAVGDTMLGGIARLLYVAYDSQACSLELDGAAFSAFISGSTAEWFRERGCAEWYCIGAGNLFHTSRPRTLAESMLFIKRRRSPGKKKRAA